MKQATRCAMALLVVGTLALAGLGFSSRTAAQSKLIGTPASPVVITQVTHTLRLTELKLSPVFVQQLLLNAPLAASHMFVRGFVTEQPHDAVALRIYQAMLQHGYRFTYPSQTKPYAIDDALTNAAYIKKGSPDILVQSAAVSGAGGNGLFAYLWRQQTDDTTTNRFLTQLKGYKTYVHFYGGSGYYDGHFAPMFSPND